MKKLIATTLACTAVGLAAYAQGTLNFANVGVGLNSPVFLSDGTTKAAAGYTAVLMAGPAGNLAQIATTPLLTGAQAGYFLGGTQTIPTVAGGGTASILIDVYNSATYSSLVQAQNANTPNSWGESAAFTVVLGNPNSVPPGTPATLTGLKSFNLTTGVPEPSTFALAGLGAAALLFFRRRN